MPRDTHLIEHHLGGVRRANAVLLVLLSLRKTLGSRWNDERRLPATAQLRIDRRDDDVDVGDAAIGDPRLRAVEHPFVGGRVVHRTRAQRRHVAAGIRLAHAERTELHIIGGAIALGRPLHHLLGRAGRGDTGGGEPRPEDRQANAGIAPEELLGRDRIRESARVECGVRSEVERVQAVLRRFLHDGPRELFAFVPLVGRRPDHIDRELVNPFLDLELVFIGGQRELGHEELLGRDRAALGGQSAERGRS